MNKPKMKRSLRTRFLLNPRFQLNIITKFLVLAIALNFIFLLVFLLYFNNISSFALNQGIPAKHIFFVFLDQLRNDFLIYYIIGLSSSLLLFVMGGIVISHKISGPLYKFTKVLQEANTLEDLKGLQFRSKDYFQELPDEMRKLIERYEESKKNN